MVDALGLSHVLGAGHWPIVTLTRCLLPLAWSRSAMAVDSSIPDTGTPRAASGNATLPLPTANSSAAPSPAKLGQQIDRRAERMRVEHRAGALVVARCDVGAEVAPGHP